MKWVKFTREFNFVPAKKAAVTIQHPAGAVDSVTDEHAEKAIAKKAAIEIEAPGNADEERKLRSGEIEAKAVTVKAEKPAAPATAPKS